MKRITVSVDDEIHRIAKARAAEKGTSVSAMVRDYLVALSREDVEAGKSEPAGPEKPGSRLSEIIEGIFARGGGIDPKDNLSREELYDRNAFR